MHLSGGNLGGGIDTSDAEFAWEAIGTGDLSGFHRTLVMPLFADPDFCAFRIEAGSDFGLPSPGATIATKLPGDDFAVDSFFDITYRIEFEGCPGSVLEDLSGATTATIRLSTR